jgi:predicted permease
MYWLRRILLILPGRRRARALELEEELRTNLSLAVDDAASSGLSRSDAERTARRDFGSLTRAQEEARAVWLPGWDTLSQELRFAARTIRRSPGFTAVAVLSLALGTGAATALFSLVDTVTLRPLAYRDPGRLVFIREVVPPLAHIYPTVPVNLQHFGTWRQQARSFETLSALRSDSVTLLSGGDPVVIGAAAVSANLFDALGVQPEIGRAFLEGDDTQGKPRTALISDGLWRRRFGAAPSVVGSAIQFEGFVCTVAGVLPPSFRFPKKGDLGPLTGFAERTDVFLALQDDSRGWGGDYDYSVFGRLRPGVTLSQASAELNVLESGINMEHNLEETGLHVQIRPLQEVIGSPVRTGLAVLLAAVLVLVLIVCVNLANLLLARASARAREFALRMALGASRRRLVFSALVETLLLSCAGGVLGVIAAQLAVRAFVRTSPVDLPRLDEVRIDAVVLAFAFGLSLAAGLLFGLLPALRLSRTDPQSALRGAAHNIAGARPGLQLREWLVGSEVALSTVLLVLAGLLVTSLWHVLRVDRGFAIESALDIRLELPSRYRAVEDRAAFLDRAAGRLRTLPGVRPAAVASKVPLTGESNVNSVHLPDGDALDPVTRQLVMVNGRYISEDYFSALGIPLLQGRAIESGDRDRNVAVISSRLAAKLWPGQNPLGKIIASAGSFIQQVEVVGVVADVHSTQLERDPTLIVYFPFWKRSFQASDLVVRAASDPRLLAQQVRAALREIDPSLPAPKMRTMGDLVEESVAQRRFQMRVAAAFAGSALLLAALGIYGVVAYGVSLRRRELGVRLALGARIGQVYRLVVWQGLRPVSLGLLAGVLAATAVGRLVRSLLFGVGTADGWILGIAAAGFACIATLACLAPAYSAVRIDPAQVLRDE